ncbi:conserved exported protein of unknown function [Agreia sp. COWG]|nr:conserved exported protein of unknown function [Agreia sp. COWG]
MAGVVGLAAIAALAPPPEAEAAKQETTLASGAQFLQVTEGVNAAPIARDQFSTVAGVQTLASGSTNRDWAEMVMLLGGFPRTEDNVTVMMRWMRQENGPDDWWNRNNPLNNGWGSGGNSGLGTYDSLVIAAENAAEALHSNPGYSAIVDGFASQAPTRVIEQAIWASPWATSHYANGAHWSQSPVPVIASPPGTW